MKLCSTDTILDAACGLGESTRYLARTYGCTVFGIDLSRRILQSAIFARDPSNPNFLASDGDQLPFRDNTFSAAISECSLCLMQDFRHELREIFRTLKRNGRIGITDIVTNGMLPVELEETLSRFLCIATNTSALVFQRILQKEGFEKVEVSDESESLRELLETVRKRLLVAELLTAVGKLSLDREKLDQGKHLVHLAKTALDEETLGYAMITGQKPSL